MSEAAPSRDYSADIHSSFGLLRATVCEAGVRGLRFAEGCEDEDDQHPLLDALREYLARYRLDPSAPCTLPLAPAGTPFEQRVWQSLRSIPPGTTRTYADVAQAIGSRDASRAVGRANGANPIAILIPCHRVIASDGTLHGYAGGLERKRALLEHEGALAPLFTRPATDPEA